MTSLCVKFQPYSTPPSDRFWWGVVVVLVLVLVVVRRGKQSQLLVPRLKSGLWTLDWSLTKIASNI